MASPTSSKSVSLSRTRASPEDVRTAAESMLRSSFSQDVISTSSSATTLRASTEPTSPAKPPVSASTTTRTRDRLRSAELELEKAQEAIKEQRAIAERLKREGAATDSSSAESKRRIRQLEQDVRISGAETARRPTTGLFKAICSTDLLFLIDTTSSMGPHINAAKQQVRSIVDDITEAFFNEAEVRIAVVGYKDHEDSPNIQFLDFTTSASRVRDFLGELKARGGGDTPEDVLGGMRRALDASWKHPTRCIIHIADAPPHGHTYHEPPITGDTYPIAGSEPHGLTLEPLLNQMIRLKLNYALLRINEYTDLMAFIIFVAYKAASAQCKLYEGNKFYNQSLDMSSQSHSSLYSGQGSKASAKIGLVFEEAELGTTYTALRHLVVNSVMASVSRTVGRMSASPARTTKGWLEKKLGTDLGAIEEDEDAVDDTLLETILPQWDSPSWFTEKLRVEGFSPDVMVHGALSLNDMMASDGNIKMSTAELTIRKRTRPFAQGAMRLATYARTAASTNRFVVKSYKRNGKRLAHLAEDMRCQALCKAFALEFNALTEERRPIDFIVTTCFREKGGTASSKECMSLEPFLEGTYVKYNSNCGWVDEDNADDRFSQAAQAFSHFTFERSKGRFLVSDLQGVGSVLTDPAVHALDRDRFKLADTNLGAEGFKFFFASHKCNSVCKKLGLKSTGAMIRTGIYRFREDWPRMENTVCCSNKLCGKIVRLASVKESEKYPGYLWCETCWPQLSSFMVQRVCIAPGPDHEFEECKFFHESQGQGTPRKCATHREEGTIVHRTAKISNYDLSRLFSDSEVPIPLRRYPERTYEPAITSRTVRRGDSEMPSSHIVDSSAARSSPPTYATEPERRSTLPRYTSTTGRYEPSSGAAPAKKRKPSSLRVMLKSLSCFH